MHRCSHEHFQAIVKRTVSSARLPVRILLVLNWFLCVAALANTAPIGEPPRTTSSDPSQNEAPWHMNIEGLPPLNQRLPSDPFEVDHAPARYSPTITIIGGGTPSSIDCEILPNGTKAPSSHRVPRSISLDERLTLATIDGFIPNVANNTQPIGDRTVEIHLRNLRWSDGEPVTGFDIQFSLELSEKYGVYQPIMAFLDSIPIVSEVTDHYLQLAFDEPVFDFDFLLSQIEIYPEHKARPIIEELFPNNAEGDNDGQTTSEHAGIIKWRFRVCARSAGILPSLGAYILDSYKRTGGRSTAIYRANPYYFKIDSDGRQQPYFEKVEHYILDDVELMFAYAKQYSEAPLVIELPISAIEHVDGFLKHKKMNIKRRPVAGRGSAAAYLFNYADRSYGELFGTRDFRRATLYAIDREFVVQIFRPNFTGVAGQTATLDWDTRDDGDPYDYDVTKAVQLVLPLYDNIELSILVDRDDALAIQVAEKVASDWEKLRIATSVWPITRAELFDREKNHAFSVIVRPTYLTEAAARSRPGLLVPPFRHGQIGETFSMYNSLCDSGGSCDPVELADVALAWQADQVTTPELIDQHESSLLIIGLISPLPDIELYGAQLTSIQTDFSTGSGAYFVGK